jgi:hypothetical protein
MQELAAVHGQLLETRRGQLAAISSSEQPGTSRWTENDSSSPL